MGAGHLTPILSLALDQSPGVVTCFGQFGFLTDFSVILPKERLSESVKT